MSYNSCAMRRKFLGALSIAALLWASISFAASSKHHHSSANGQPGDFDYFLLSVSWAPNYCAGDPSDHSSECRAGAGKVSCCMVCGHKRTVGLISRIAEAHRL